MIYDLQFDPLPVGDGVHVVVGGGAAQLLQGRQQPGILLRHTGQHLGQWAKIRAANAPLVFTITKKALTSRRL